MKSSLASSTIPETRLLQAQKIILVGYGKMRTLLMTRLRSQKAVLPRSQLSPHQQPLLRMLMETSEEYECRFAYRHYNCFIFLIYFAIASADISALQIKFKFNAPSQFAAPKI